MLELVPATARRQSDQRWTMATRPCNNLDFSEVIGDGAAIVDDANGWRRCNGDGFLVFNRDYVSACISGNFSRASPCCLEAGNGGVSPLLDYQMDCYYIPYTSTLGTFTLLLCLLGALVNVSGLVWLIKNRKTRAVKAGQFHFLVMFVIGFLLLSVASLPFLGDITTSNCVWRTLLMNLAAAFVYVSVSVKIYRVWKIFGNKTIKKAAYSTRSMLIFAAGVMLIEVLLLLISFASPQFASKATTETARVDVSMTGLTYDRGLCKYKDWTMWYLFMLLNGAGFCVTSFLSFKARAPSAFHEGQTLWVIHLEAATVLGLVGLVLSSMKANISEAQRTFLLALGFNLVSILSTALMLVPKAFERHEYLTEEAKERRARIARTATTSPSSKSPNARPGLRRSSTDYKQRAKQQDAEAAKAASAKVHATSDDIPDHRHTVDGSLNRIPSVHEMKVGGE